MRDATSNVDKGEVAEFAIGAIEAGGELGRKLEHEAGAFGGDLPEARIGHLGKFAGIAGADPGAAGRRLVKEAHLAEELPFVEVGEHHLVAFLVLDHHLDRAVDDVVQHIGQVARVDDHGL